MPGAWTKDGGALHLNVGSYIEGGVKDDSGRHQGTVVLGVREIGGRHGGLPSVSCTFLGCSDPHYLWWMTSGEGTALKEEAWYHLCGKKPADCGAVRKKTKMIHLTKVREVGPGDFSAGNLDCQKVSSLRDPFEANLKAFNRWVRKRGKPETHPGGKTGPVEAQANWESDPASSEEEKSEEEEESSSRGKKLKERLADLRKQLTEAEKDAADYQGKRKKRKKKKKKKKSDSDEPKKKESKKDEKKPEKKKKKKESSESGEPVKKRKKRDDDDSDEGKGSSKEKKRRKEKKKKDSDTTTSSESLEKDPKALFAAKKSAGKKGEKEEGDRGPFGEGPPVDFGDDSDDSDASVFQDAPSKSMRSSQLKLLSYSRKHPGRLASRMLLKMQLATARGLEGASKKNLTPVVAMNHLLTVMQPALQGKLGVRSLRELKTLATALDLMSEGKTSRAADVLAQRVKAIERATVEQHWNSAQFLELLMPENTTLLERDEEAYLAKEFLADQKVRHYDQRGPGKGKQHWEPKGRGKRKDDQKGEKGKGKDKKNKEKEG